METKCYLQGEYINLSEAKIPVSDRGFLYGDGLFETIKVYEGRPFFLEQHLDRLMKGTAVLGINLGKKPEEFKAALGGIIEETIRINKLKDGFIRLSLSRGSGRRGLLPQECRSPLLLVVPYVSVPYNDEDYEKGYRTVIVQCTRRNTSSPLSRLKSLNYLDNILGKIETDQKGADEGIFLNERGNLSGGTVSNIFIVKGKNIFTPTVHCAILNGITRQIVIKLAKKNNIEIIEKPLPPTELMEAEEAFLTNSLMEIMPLVSVEGKSLGNGKPGPYTVKLRNEFLKMVNNPDPTLFSGS